MVEDARAQSDASKQVTEGAEHTKVIKRLKKELGILLRRYRDEIRPDWEDVLLRSDQVGDRSGLLMNEFEPRFRKLLGSSARKILVEDVEKGRETLEPHEFAAYKSALQLPPEKVVVVDLLYNALREKLAEKGPEPTRTPGRG
jgi:hypothetical protein